MERMLPPHNENEDNEETMGPGTMTCAYPHFLQRVTITVIAIRDEDEAMVSSVRRPMAVLP